MSTTALADLRAGDAPRFGGKSASLGELLRSGLPVPPGFAVSVETFAAFVDAGGLRDQIAAALGGLDPDNVGAVRAAAHTAAAAIREAPLPAALGDELAAAYAALAQASGDEQPAVAVRSSAVGEDSSEATFAGQQQTLLWVRGPERVAEAVRECWASLYSAEAISYRARLADGGPPPGMGVTVQLMVDAAVSGVLFTCNPVSGDPSVIAIDASWGLGLGVVGGEVTPDQFVVSKVTGEVVRQTISTKTVQYVPAPGGDGPVAVDVAADRADAPCLSDGELRALVDVGRAVERHFGGRQDVEWAIDGRGELFLLQARPVTASEKAQGPTGVSAMALVMSTFGVGDRKR